MEIKVKCACGSVYSFEEEPVNGRLRFPVSCTNCGLDGTDRANAYIAAQLSGKSDSASPKKSLFSFLKKKEADDASPEPASASAASFTSEDDATSRQLVAAITGSLIVGVLGAIGWLFLARITGYQFGYAAWLLGGIVGGTARALAPRGHYWLGMIAAIAALIAIGGGEFLTARWAIKEETRAFATSAYEEAAQYASEAASATTEEELRAVTARYKLASMIAGENSSDGLATYRNFQVAESGFVAAHIIERDEPIVAYARQEEAADEENVTAAELERFKTSILPDLKAFAAGKPSQQEYESAVAGIIESRTNFKTTLLATMGPFSWLWVILGVATAFKVARKY